MKDSCIYQKALLVCKLHEERMITIFNNVRRMDHEQTDTGDVFPQ